MIRYTIKNQLKDGFVEYSLHDGRDVDYAGVQKLGRYEDIDENPERLVKVKKALEIIKEVDLKVSSFIEDWCNNSEDCYADYVHLCNDYHNDGYKRILLKEEFNLLIEVLA